MSSTPKISKGLNKFSPSLFDRMGKAIEVAERSEFDDQLKGFKVWPSFWATIIGFHWLNFDPAEPVPRINKFLYMWDGAGFSSGVDPEDEEFAPAVNLAEARGTPDTLGTYLGVNVQNLITTTGYSNMPYINSLSPIIDPETGIINQGIGNKREKEGWFTSGTGPTVRMYLLEIRDSEDLNPATGEPYDIDDSIGVYAFSATPCFDGFC